MQMQRKGFALFTSTTPPPTWKYVASQVRDLTNKKPYWRVRRDVSSCPEDDSDSIFAFEMESLGVIQWIYGVCWARESRQRDKVLRNHSCAGPKSQGAGDGRFPALLSEDSAGRRSRQSTLRARLCRNLQVEQHFENMPKMPTCCDKLVFYGTKRPCRKAGIPLYDSNFRDRPIFYESKRVHRKVGMFLERELFYSS